MASPARAIALPQLKNILCATDFSGCSAGALEFACALARNYGSTIHVVHVAAREHENKGASTRGGQPNGAQSSMTKLLASHSLKDIPHESLIEDGSAAEVLCALFEREGFDLIALGTHGRGREQQALGSIAEQVFRRAPRAVLTVAQPLKGGGPARRQIERVLFATDFSAGSLQALPHAVSLAEKNHAQLLLLYVDTAQSTLEWLMEAKVEGKLEDLVPKATARACKVQPIIELGPVADKIVEVAAMNQADVVVMGASANARMSTASEVVAKAQCPVLTVRS